MATEFVLITNVEEEGGANILFSPCDELVKELPASQIERFFQAKGFHFSDCMNVRQDELQYYCIDIRYRLSNSQIANLSKF